MGSPLIVTVSQLNRRISLMLKNDRSLVNLSVRGEISNFKVHYKSGHIYFSLGDDAASVKAVMFRSYAEKLAFMPEDGMSVVVTGSVQCYERDGVYQIYVTEIIPAGAGEQAAAKRQLAEKLRAEGLFAPERKRARPALPRKICVITSETGAALQDIRNVLERRDPLIKLVLIPALVQGENAPDSVCAAFRIADRTDADLVIFGRGGGSAEDLSAFDTEQVARAVAACRAVTISAVGHETDWCIADLAADYRAPTPSAAAELAVPDRQTLCAYPEAVLSGIRTKLANRLYTLSRAADAAFAEVRMKNPRGRLEINSSLLESKQAEIRGKVSALVARREQALSEQASVISALNPLAVLMRGYSIVYRDGKAVSRVGQLSAGDRVTIRLSDGEARAEILPEKKGKSDEV